MKNKNTNGDLYDRKEGQIPFSRNLNFMKWKETFRSRLGGITLSQNHILKTKELNFAVLKCLWMGLVWQFSLSDVTFTVCWQFVGKPSHLWRCWLMSLSSSLLPSEGGLWPFWASLVYSPTAVPSWGIFHKKITPG